MISVSLSLNDTGGVCECDDCIKANDGVNPNKVNADRVVWKYMNAVAKGIAEKRPDRGISLYTAYWPMRSPPAGLKAEGNILGIVCHFDHNTREFDDPNCQYNKMFVEQTKALATAGAEMGCYDYILYPLTPQPVRLINNVKAYHKLGLTSYTCQFMNNSVHHTMVRWALAQLAWNPDQDPRKLVEEFCAQMYGAASVDVLAVIDRIEASLKTLPKVTLGGIGAAQEVMTDEVIAFCRERMKAAQGKVRGAEAERLRTFAQIQLYGRTNSAAKAGGL